MQESSESFEDKLRCFVYCCLLFELIQPSIDLLKVRFFAEGDVCFVVGVSVAVSLCYFDFMVVDE